MLDHPQHRRRQLQVRQLAAFLAPTTSASESRRRRAGLAAKSVIDDVTSHGVSMYRELGVNLTYSPDGRVNVQVLPRGVNVRVGGGT
jgi:hypothetical protein